MNRNFHSLKLLNMIFLKWRYCEFVRNSNSIALFLRFSVKIFGSVSLFILRFGFLNPVASFAIAVISSIPFISAVSSLLALVSDSTSSLRSLEFSLSSSFSPSLLLLSPIA